MELEIFKKLNDLEARLQENAEKQRKFKGYITDDLAYPIDIESAIVLTEEQGRLEAAIAVEEEYLNNNLKLKRIMNDFLAREYLRALAIQQLFDWNTEGVIKH